MVIARAWAVVALVMALVVGCGDLAEPPFGNTVDPDSPSYVPPQTTILEGPEDGETYNQTTVTFRWQGSHTSSQFHYRLARPGSGRADPDEAEWSDWATATSATFDYLDEGLHTLSVQSRYAPGVEEKAPVESAFAVDAVKGPAMMLAPRRVVVARGDAFLVRVVAEEVRGLAVAEAHVRYDAARLRFVGLSDGEFLDAEGGALVLLPDPDTEGWVRFTTGVALANPKTAESSGALATVEFRAISAGAATLSLQADSKLLDARGEVIPTTELLGCLVVTE